MLGGIYIFNIFKKKKNKEKSQTNSVKDLLSQKEDEKFSMQVDRNLKGKELEREGSIDEVINLYEKNLSKSFEGNHPYERLAIIYRKKKLYNEGKRVLEKAIQVFKENISNTRSDRDIKLNRFKERLDSLNEKHL